MTDDNDARAAAAMREKAAEQIRETIGEADFFGDKHGRQVLERALANVEAIPLPGDPLPAALRLPEVAKLIEAAEALRSDMLERSRAGIDAIHGDSYRIVNAGRTAWADFSAALAAIRARSEGGA